MDGLFQSPDRLRDALKVLLLLYKNHGKNLVHLVTLGLELETDYLTVKEIAFNLHSQRLLEIMQDGHAHLSFYGAEVIKWALSHPEREAMGFPAASTIRAWIEKKVGPCPVHVSEEDNPSNDGKPSPVAGDPMVAPTAAAATTKSGSLPETAAERKETAPAAKDPSPSPATPEDRSNPREIGGRTKPRRRAKLNPVVQKIKKKKVRDLYAEGIDHKSICERLGSFDRPPRAKWRDDPWPVAYKKHTSAVTKWISETCSGHRS